MYIYIYINIYTYDVIYIYVGDVLCGAQGRAGALQPCVEVRDCESGGLLLLLARNFARLFGVRRYAKDLCMMM